jgi:hypothetical protein
MRMTEHVLRSGKTRAWAAEGMAAQQIREKAQASQPRGCCLPGSRENYGVRDGTALYGEGGDAERWLRAPHRCGSNPAGHRAHEGKRLITSGSSLWARIASRRPTKPEAESYREWNGPGPQWITQDSRRPAANQQSEGSVADRTPQRPLIRAWARPLASSTRERAPVEPRASV